MTVAEASAVVLAGFRLRSDVKIVRWPDRYMDGRDREFWGRLMALLPRRIMARRPLGDPSDFGAVQRLPDAPAIYTVR